MLEKLERLEPPEWPASSIRIQLPPPDRSARIVVEAKDLAKSYDTTPVFTGVSFQILRGQKVGLIGPNGVGKTTLARIMIGEESQSAGSVRIGPAVQVGYAEQEQAKLRGSRSVLDEVWAVTPSATEGEIRGFLGGFLFRGDEVFKPLNALSGGERSRVALAKLVREGANFLILDEPTNHLDIESREVIEAALRAFGGTVLVVSHDRYFLDRVVDHVMELKTDGCRVWEGGYSHYAHLKAARSATEAPAPVSKESAAKPGPSKIERVQSYEVQKRRKREEERLRRRVKDAEAAIDRLEEARQALLLEMAEPEAATDADRLGELNTSLKSTEREIKEAISEWERLSMRLEAFLDGPNQ